MFTLFEKLKNVRNFAIYFKKYVIYMDFHRRYNYLIWKVNIGDVKEGVPFRQIFVISSRRYWNVTTALDELS